MVAQGSARWSSVGPVRRAAARPAILAAAAAGQFGRPSRKPLRLAGQASRAGSPGARRSCRLHGRMFRPMLAPAGPDLASLGRPGFEPPGRSRVSFPFGCPHARISFAGRATAISARAGHTPDQPDQNFSEASAWRTSSPRSSATSRTRRRAQRNKAVKSSLKTAVRQFREAADAGDAEKVTQTMRSALTSSWTRPRARASSTRTRRRTASRPSPSAPRSSRRPDRLPGRQCPGAHQCPGCERLSVPRVFAGARVLASFLMLVSGPSGKPRSSRIATLKGVAGAGPFALDLSVSRATALCARATPSGAPAAELLPDLVDLPRRHAELGRQRVGALPAGALPTRPSAADPLRQRAGDQHRRYRRSPAPSAAAPARRPACPRPPGRPR